MEFIDILVRQAHPGPQAPAYRRFEEKMADAEAYQREEAIPWIVAVDDVDGTVHQAYGGLADPAYLVGTDGRISFFQPITGVPSLERALGELVAQDGRGVVAGGVDRLPHVLPPLTEGWRALERGLPQSADDLDHAVPGSVALFHLGHRLRPLLAPLTLRSRPLSRPARFVLAAGVATGFGLAMRASRHDREESSTVNAIPSRYDAV